MKNFGIIVCFMLTTTTQASTISQKLRLDAYTKQYEASVKYLLENMLVTGATVASPSKAEPDYYFDWVRDSSLAMKEVVEIAYDSHWPSGQRDQMKKRISTWIDWELSLQTTPKPQDLGEPKFLVTGKVFEGPWARPQNDGPALRALTAITIANHWIQEGKLDDVKKLLYAAEIPATTLIKRDLEYVAHHWSEKSFDIWEEEKAFHFYTMTVQYVALLKGSALAKRLDDKAAADFYLDESNKMKSKLADFVQGSDVVYALEKENGLSYKTSDYDTAILLAAVETFDGKFYVPYEAIVKTVNKMIDVFRKLYEVNKTVERGGVGIGIALGRYPEDRYNGNGTGEGNPWFISTLALGQFACQLKTVQPSSTHDKLDKVAIEVLNRVLLHRDQSGRMSEQFNKTTGKMQGAHDLSWSYAAYIGAYRECMGLRQSNY